MRLKSEEENTILLHNKLTKITILSASVLLAGLGVGSVFLPNLQSSYPNVSDTLLKSFVSLPCITQLIGTLSAGFVANKFTKKKTLILCFMLFTISGLIPIFNKSFYIMLLSRMILGLSLGYIQPISTSLIADYFTGSQRNQMMGFQSAVSGVSNVLMPLIVSIFLADSWRNAFWVYIIGVVPFILSILFLNKPQNEFKEKQRSIKTKDKISWKELCFWIIAMFMFNLAFSGIILNFSLTVVNTHAGSVVTAAKVTSLVGCMGIFAGIIFEKYSKITKKFSGIISIGIMLLGNLLMIVAHNIIIFSIADALINLGFGLFMPYIMNAINLHSSKKSSAQITGIVLSAGTVANFLSTYIYRIFLNLFQVSNIQFNFYFSSLCCICLLIELVIMLKKHLI